MSPDPEMVTPARAAVVLKRLGHQWATDPLQARLPPPPIVPLSMIGARDWWVGEDAVVSFQGRMNLFPHEGVWVCDCTPYSPAECEHVATALLVHAWNRPDLRRLFEQPTWAIDLEGLLRAEADGSQPPADGWIQYTLKPGDGIPVERSLLRLSRRDGRTLRPKPVPTDFDNLLDEIRGLTRADAAFHDAVMAYQAIGRSSEAGTDGLRARLAARAFSALLDVEALAYEETPILADKEPFVPTVEVVDDADYLALDWAEPLLAAYDIGPGYVVTEDGVLRPLARRGFAGDVQSLVRPLPRVPQKDAKALLQRFIREAGVAVSLQSNRLPATCPPERVEGRVHLDDRDGGLLVSLRFGYKFAGRWEEVEPDAQSWLLDFDDALVPRNPATESRLSRGLAKVLGRSAPATLRGNSSLDFLLDAPRQLGPDYVFFGERALLDHRVAGTLAPRVDAPSGVDWFDLKVSFTVDGKEAKAAAVLESWRAGRRYHRMTDGTLARLPEDWLMKHGAVSLELSHLRKGRERLGAFAAPLVLTLLEEATGDVARWHELADRLRPDTPPEPRPVPPQLNATLRPYQVDGYQWVCGLRALGLGGCLADDMGLGKTIQAITVLLDSHKVLGAEAPSLVVAPTSVVHNWADELGRFAPDMRVRVHHGPLRDPEDKFDDVDVVLTTYPLLRQDDTLFTDRKWTWAILDEAQNIKNPAAQVAKTARALVADHRLALTGTPLENRLLELWSIFEFLMPGFFGARRGFSRRYAAPVERGEEEAIAALQMRIRPFLLRRLKGEVAKELPPRQEQVLYCDLGEAQRELYERVKATYRTSVMGRVTEVGVKAATLSVLEALMRLRQACCDPGLLPFPEAKQVTDSAKMDLLLDTLDESIAAGHRTLIFSQWPSLLKRVTSRLAPRGWRWLYLDGSTTQRKTLVDQWNDPEGPPLFLISLKAGGSGLNLTGADHVIHLDPWWNPAVEDQATDRAHRIGQTKPVVAYKIVARDTVEEKILQLQDRKRALFAAAVDEARSVESLLTAADLEAVFSVGMEVEPFEQNAAPAPTRPVPASNNGNSRDPESLLRVGARLTNTEVRQFTGWSAEKARRWLQIKVEEGTLEQRGQRRGTHYVVLG